MLAGFGHRRTEFCQYRWHICRISRDEFGSTEDRLQSSPARLQSALGPQAFGEAAPCECARGGAEKRPRIRPPRCLDKLGAGFHCTCSATPQTRSGSIFAGLFAAGPATWPGRQTPTLRRPSIAGVPRFGGRLASPSDGVWDGASNVSSNAGAERAWSPLSSD